MPSPYATRAPTLDCRHSRVSWIPRGGPCQILTGPCHLRVGAELEEIRSPVARWGCCDDRTFRRTYDESSTGAIGGGFVRPSRGMLTCASMSDGREDTVQSSVSNEAGEAEHVHLARIEHELSPPTSPSSVGRRSFLGTAAAAAAASTVLSSSVKAFAKVEEASSKNLAASPPAGFVPMAAPGKIVKVSKRDSLKPNGLYPKEDDAKTMLTKALTELTGKPDLPTAIGQFVHKDDIVCVKVNGIAKANMATNRELVLPFLEAMIQYGVKPENITVLEQYGEFLAGTRINAQNVPKGVKVATHSNGNATMDDRIIPGTRTRTKFVRYLTEATAAISFSLIKDHSICGYTGQLKNMTHGCTINPHDFHVHHASPQIASMYAQDVIKSRIRLCIADGFKVMYDGGPLWKRPEAVKPHESIYVSTDPVAMDAIGWDIVEKFRSENRLKTLAEVGREPSYIKAAADLGLGVFDRSKIKVQEFAI